MSTCVYASLGDLSFIWSGCKDFSSSSNRSIKFIQVLVLLFVTLLS